MYESCLNDGSLVFFVNLRDYGRKILFYILYLCSSHNINFNSNSRKTRIYSRTIWNFVNLLADTGLTIGPKLVTAYNLICSLTVNFQIYQ